MPQTFCVNEISLGENFATGGGGAARPKKPPQNRAPLTADEIKEGRGQTADYLPPRRRARVLPPCPRWDARFRLTRRPSRRSFSTRSHSGEIEFSREGSTPRATLRAAARARCILLRSVARHMTLYYATRRDFRVSTIHFANVEW